MSRGRRSAQLGLVASFFAGALLLTAGTCAASSVSYDSYTYDYWGNPVSSPHAYLPVRSIDGASLGIGHFRGPRDIFVDTELRVYIADTGNDRVVVLDDSWNLLSVIEEFRREGGVDRFRSPEGLHVTEDGRLYVADRGNNRIVILDKEGRFLGEIGSPPPDLEGVIPANFQFRPKRIAVDQVGRLYVVAEEVYEGIMEFGVDGRFRGFIGAPRVAPNPLDVLWRRIATREQRERLALFIPTEFTSISLDERGFIYATVPPTSGRYDQVIRRLNPTGADVLRRRGFHPPVGDVRFTQTWEPASITGRSMFVDIVAHDYGIYSALDQRRGRVFTYDSQGNLLYVFGGPGNQLGTFQSAIALSRSGNDIVVLDAVASKVTLFEQTEYGRLIADAIRFHQSGLYDEAEQAWREVLKLNANFDLAYSGIGKAFLRRNEFREAMRYFRLGNDRDGYSDALKLYRREVIEDHFGTIVVAVGLVAAGGAAVPRIRQRRARFGGGAGEIAPVDPRLHSKGAEILSGLVYSLTLMARPIRGFWDLKHERRGNLPAALVLIGAVCFTYIVMRQYTGFLFNPFDPNSLNIFVEVSGVVVPVGLWTLVNWSLTTLMDGKGTLKDVLIATAYALTPIVVINLPATVLSNFLSLEEGAFYYLLLSLSSAWTLLLLFTGTMVTHDYSLLKTGLTIAGVLAGIVFVLFIALLFVSIADVLVSFVTDIYKELIFRL